MTRSRVALTLDGGSAVLDVAPAETLADVLHLHEGCGEGVCGACTVVVDGVPVRACLMLALQAEGSDVKTVASLPVIEGSPTDAAGLTPLQRALRSAAPSSAGGAFRACWSAPPPFSRAAAPSIARRSSPIWSAISAVVPPAAGWSPRSRTCSRPVGSARHDGTLADRRERTAARGPRSSHRPRWLLRGAPPGAGARHGGRPRPARARHDRRDRRDGRPGPRRRRTDPTAADLDRKRPPAGDRVEEGALPAHRPLLAAGRVRHVGSPSRSSSPKPPRRRGKRPPRSVSRSARCRPFSITAASLAGAVRLHDGDNAADTLHHAVGDRRRPSPPPRTSSTRLSLPQGAGQSAGAAGRARHHRSRQRPGDGGGEHADPGRAPGRARGADRSCRGRGRGDAAPAWRRLRGEGGGLSGGDPGRDRGAPARPSRALAGDAARACRRHRPRPRGQRARPHGAGRRRRRHRARRRRTFRHRRLLRLCRQFPGRGHGRNGARRLSHPAFQGAHAQRRHHEDAAQRLPRRRSSAGGLSPSSAAWTAPPPRSASTASRYAAAT